MKLKNILFLITLYSCSSNSDNSLPQLHIANTIDKENIELKDKGLEYNNVSIVLFESTKESLLGNFTIIGANDSLIVVNSNNNIYFFDSIDGKYKSRVSKKGRGYGEYISIWCGKVDFKEKKLDISDNTSHKIITYTFDGEVVNSINNDSIMWFASDSKRSLAFSTPYKSPIYKYSLYDNKWNYIHGVTALDVDKSKFRGTVTIPSLFTSNDVIYTASGDTISYLDDNNRLKNLLLLDKGNCKLPSDLKSIEKQSEYISADYFFVIDNNIYYRYLYQNCYHEELWDIKSQKLIYKKIHKGSFDEFYNFIADSSSEMGLPIKYMDKIVYGTPIYLNNNKLFFTVNSSISSGLKKSDNPMLLVATI